MPLKLDRDQPFSTVHHGARPYIPRAEINGTHRYGDRVPHYSQGGVLFDVNGDEIEMLTIFAFQVKHGRNPQAGGG